MHSVWSEIRRVFPSIVTVMSLMAGTASAQDERRAYAGALVGVSTLSADGRSQSGASEIAVSLYKPENGLALNLFGGYHVAQYFTLQGDYMWNHNDVALVSSFATPTRGGFYEQQRRSSQHAVVADTLIYFRRLDSAVRPYLGTGLSVVHFASRSIVSSQSSGLDAPAHEISDTSVALRSHVGIDVVLARRLMFRYSFSETIGPNPISSHLTPPGERRLANFENLFGLVARF